MDSAITLVSDVLTVPDIVTSEDEQTKNAPESAALGTFAVACATVKSTTEYSTNAVACQIAAAPSLAEIVNEIATAARQRIEAALRDLNETRARIERERNARDAALSAAQERASKAQAHLDGLAGERAAMEQRAQAFLVGDALKATLEKIHLAFNVKQLELEDALAVAEADVHETQTEIQAATISDALELQLSEQHFDELQTAAPDVAEAVHLAADAAQNVAAALEAVKDGLLHDAEVLLAKATAGNADPAQISKVEQALTEARQAQIVRDLTNRMNTMVDQPGAMRRIRKIVEEAEAVGVADRIAQVANRALAAARHAANARYVQARPIGEHLASEGYIPVIRDGRIEVWAEIPANGSSIRADANAESRNGTSWTLDRVMLLREGVWKTEKPRVPVTRRVLPQGARRPRRFKQPHAESVTPTE